MQTKKLKYKIFNHSIQTNYLRNKDYLITNSSITQIFNFLKLLKLLVQIQGYFFTKFMLIESNTFFFTKKYPFLRKKRRNYN